MIMFPGKMTIFKFIGYIGSNHNDFYRSNKLSIRLMKSIGNRPECHK